MSIAGIAVSGMTGCAKKTYNSYDDSDLVARISRLEGRGTAFTSRMHPVPAGMKGANMALPTGSESSSAILVEKFVPELVAPGEAYEYMIMVTNLTDTLYLEGVEVRDRFAGEYALASSSPSGMMEGNVGVWGLGTLAPGETKTITINGAVSGSGEVSSCTTIDYTPVLCLDYEAEKAALEANCGGDTDVTACDTINYTVTVRNTGSGVARNVEVTNVLPEGLTAEGGATQNLGNLDAGQSANATFRVSASAGGSYTSNIRVTSDNADTQECASITTTVCQPALGLDLSGTNNWYMSNSGVFEAVVKNTSNCETKNVRVTADIPSNTRFSSATEGGSGSGSSATWNLGTMAAGEERTLTLRLDAASINEGTLSFTATGDCAETRTDSEPITIKGIPAILLEVVDITDPVRVGDSTTYVITATNQGSAVGTNIAIQTMVEQMTVTSATGATTGSISGKNVTFEALPSLAPGAKAEWRVQVTVDAAGDQRFTTIMNSDQLSRPVQETEATNCYE